MTARSNDQTELALLGGRPVRDEFLVFGRPCIGEEEIAEVVETLRSGWIGTGPRTLRFENDFKAYVRAEHAVAVSSATAGLFLSLVALGIGRGDEVVTTALTFAATPNVIEHVGARPVLVDVDPVTLNMNPSLLEGAITSKTRAIIPVHLGGLACELDMIQNIANRHGLAVVEDAAHAIGTRYRGRMIGSLSTLTVFSFYANKNLTTAEGGMVTTSDERLAEKLRILRLHGLTQDAWARFKDKKLVPSEILLPGYKCNMSDLAAALGIHQLRRQEKFLEVRERYAGEYDRAFRRLPFRWQPRPQDLDKNRHALHLYFLLLEASSWSAHRNQVLEALRAENIGATVHYAPVHEHQFYRQKYGYSPEDFPAAHDVAERILTLPLSPSMSPQDVEDVIAAVHKVARAYCV